MKRIICLVGVLMLVLAGCATFSDRHTRTLLMDRNTGEIEECEVDKVRSNTSYETYEQCIKSFEEKGYSVWDQY